MDKVINFLENTLKDGDVIVIGNSTGPDSMALTNILLDLSKKIDIKIICAHVNHNVREQSKIEEEFLKKYCSEKNIILEHMTIEKYGDDNFHNEARTIRYNFFDRIVEKYNANYLMTAHHADDLMETILMRIVRGSSLKGYAGFRPIIEKGKYKILRPLIFVTKDEIAFYDEKEDIPYYIDQSNFKGKYTRNRYRKTVLPFLKNEDKNVHEKFIKFSNLLTEYDDFVEKTVTKIYGDIIKDNKLIISKYNEIEELLKNRLLSKMLEMYYQDDLMLINDSHIELIKKLISSNRKNSYVTLPNNVIALKTYDYLEIKLNIDDLCEYEIELNDYAKLPNGHTIERIESSDSNDNNICRISFDDVKFPLYIRTRRNGDKMKLKKIDGYRKIKDIFIDSKIDLNKRDKWPIVVDSKDEIIWIPGIKKSKFVKSKNEKCDIILKYQ